MNPSLLLKIILYNTWTLQLNKVYLNGKLYPKDNEGTSLIKRVSLIEGSSICEFNLQSFACAN
jgi:hypothetical protein